jgi:hypothetical protein
MGGCVSILWPACLAGVIIAYSIIISASLVKRNKEKKGSEFHWKQEINQYPTPLEEFLSCISNRAQEDDLNMLPQNIIAS